MPRQKLMFGLGIIAAVAGVAIFTRFWVISGMETAPDSAGMLSVLNWGSFFVSPLLVAGGVAVAIWAALSDRRRRQRSTRESAPARLVEEQLSHTR